MNGSIFADEGEFPLHVIPEKEPTYHGGSSDEEEHEKERTQYFHQNQQQFYQQQQNTRHQQEQQQQQQQQQHLHRQQNQVDSSRANGAKASGVSKPSGGVAPEEDKKDYESGQALDSIKNEEKQNREQETGTYHAQSPRNEKMMAYHQQQQQQQHQQPKPQYQHQFNGGKDVLVDLLGQRYTESIMAEKAKINQTDTFDKMKNFKETMDLIIDSMRKIAERRHPGVQGISESIQMSNARFYEVFLNGSSDPTSEIAMNYACTILDILYNNIRIVERLIISQNTLVCQQQQQEEEERRVQQLQEETLLKHQQQHPHPPHTDPPQQSSTPSLSLEGVSKEKDISEARANSVISTIKPARPPEKEKGKKDTMEKKKAQTIKTAHVPSIPRQTVKAVTVQTAPVMKQAANMPTMQMSELAEMVQNGGQRNKDTPYRNFGAGAVVPGDTKFPKQMDPNSSVLGSCSIT